MIRALLLLGGLGFLGVIALSVAAYSYFGATGAAGIGLAALLALYLAVKLLGGWLLERLVRVPFRMKGEPLRDARVRVHAVRRAAPPPQAVGDEQPAEPREWYMIELTVQPTAAPDAFRYWEPTELVLVDLRDDPDDPQDEWEWGEVNRARVWRDGAWAPVEEALEAVETRVRLLVGLRPGPPPSLRFRYYLEVFGHVDLTRAPRAAGV